MPVDEITVTVDVPAAAITVEGPAAPDVTVTLPGTGGGGEGGAVTSVNGQDGAVVLDAGDVGADPAGTAAAAVAALGDAAALDVGTTAGTVAAGNDSRLTDARTPTGGAGGVLSGTYPNPGFAVDMVEQTELTSALAGYQPLDSDLTAIAALTTTSYGRSLLTSADIAALRDALDADDKRPFTVLFSTYQATTGTVTPSGSVLYTLLAASSSTEWTVWTFPAGTWRFALNLVTTNAASLSTIQLSVGGSNLGSAVSTYDASATPRVVPVDADKTFPTRTQAAVRWTTNSSGAARCVAWTAWRTA